MPRNVGPELQSLLGGPKLAGLRKRLRRRYELAAGGQEIVAFQVGNLEPEEHNLLSGMMGRKTRRSHSIRVDVAVIDLKMRNAGIADSLRDALERLDGPIVLDDDVRDALIARWSLTFASVGEERLGRYLRTPQGMLLVKRLSESPESAVLILRQAEAVMRRLPEKGMPRAQLAAEVLGDAHAMDNGKPAATIVLAAWRQTVERPAEDKALDERERIRDKWASAGVLVNELAKPALFLNLPFAERDEAVPLGEPEYISLRRLLRNPPSWNVEGRDVFVCENANLLAIIADRLGKDCPPLICTDGMPAAAQRKLMSQMSAAGASMAYHGDFDWAGIVIGNYVMREFKALPWRYGAAEYALAAATAARPGLILEEPQVVATWDGGLVPAMKEHGIAIAEEAVAASLIDDLQKVAATVTK
jgi:uncharacterized protein (TIGR02679 family)